MNNFPKHLVNPGDGETTERQEGRRRDALLHNLQKHEPLWDTWYIDSLLGKGSFGAVYRAHRDAFGKTHYSAVKIISVPYDEAEVRQMRNDGYDEASLRRFLQALLMDLVKEIDLMNELRGNSHVVSFDDYKVIEKADSIGWDLLIRMELLTNLADHAAQHPLGLTEVIKLGIHICKALELCAQKNIIHRDIKPDNIFISQYGDYKLGDFGIARQLEHTMAGLSKKGTYTYMAPEVFRGEPYGANVDTYSLGLVMYRFLNQGRLPFLPDFPQIIMPNDREISLQRRINGELIPPLKKVSPTLNSLILKACTYNRNERFFSPTEMRYALESIARSPNNTSSLTVKQEHPPSAPPKQGQANGAPSQAWNSQPQMAEYYTPMQGQNGDAPFPEQPYRTPAQDPTPQTSNQASAIHMARQANRPTSTKLSKKRSRVPLIIGFCTIALLVLVGIFVNSLLNPATLNLSNQGLTDDDLATRVENGTIPKTVKTLDLSTNQISDLTPLQSLPNLTSLNLANNNIGNVDPLKSLTELTKLNLQNNTLSNLDPLKFLTGLTWLQLDNNIISNIKPLAPMTQLIYLGLNNNQISSLDALKSLTQITCLGLNDNRISNLDPLQALTQLTELYLDANSIYNLKPLEFLTKLTHLSLNDNISTSGLTSLEKLTELKELHLNNMSISDIQPIKSLIKLEKIYGSKLTADQILELKTALPQCAIYS